MLPGARTAFETLGVAMQSIGASRLVNNEKIRTRRLCVGVLADEPRALVEKN